MAAAGFVKSHQSHETHRCRTIVDEVTPQFLQLNEKSGCGIPTFFLKESQILSF